MNEVCKVKNPEGSGDREWGAGGAGGGGEGVILLIIGSALFESNLLTTSYTDYENILNRNEIECFCGLF